MKEVVIVDAIRTAQGKLGGSLNNIEPEVLCTETIKAIVERNPIIKDDIDTIIVGQTKQSADAPNIARVALLAAKIPEEIPAFTVHMQCASGMLAIINGSMMIKSDEANTIIAGGVESMSTSNFYLRGARSGLGSGNSLVLDPNTESQPKSQPEDMYGRFTMGLTAENVAEKYNISREEQDAFAFNSQQKAITAIDSGRFDNEIIPIIYKERKTEKIFNIDEYPRRDTSPEKLSKLRPVFKEGGSVTAGNSSGRNDGAAAVLLMDQESAKTKNMKIMGRIVSFSINGVDPRYMGMGPVPAILGALKKANLKVEDIDLFEINEAFAAQSVACVKELGIDFEKVNVNGGAIALGHPLGCSGTRICVTLLHEMEKRNLRYGCASLCVAGGQGAAIIFERQMEV